MGLFIDREHSSQCGTTRERETEEMAAKTTEGYKHTSAAEKQHKQPGETNGPPGCGATKDSRKR